MNSTDNFPQLSSEFKCRICLRELDMKNSDLCRMCRRTDRLQKMEKEKSDLKTVISKVNLKIQLTTDEAQLLAKMYTEKSEKSIRQVHHISRLIKQKKETTKNLEIYKKLLSEMSS